MHVPSSSISAYTSLVNHSLHLKTISVFCLLAFLLPSDFFFSFFGVGWDWVHLVRRPLTCLLYQPRMMDDECGAVGGMRIGSGNRSTRRKPTPVPLCPPQISHYLTRGSNPGRRGENPATTRLSYVAVLPSELLPRIFWAALVWSILITCPIHFNFFF
jgi:hypothetical protein